ncbi:hypothetical protein Hte_006214 [Hypoxylon texense]
MATDSAQFARTSGITDAVWIHEDPYANRPQFHTLTEDIETDVCIIGAGITGISIAYELVTRGREVVLVEARDVLAGESHAWALGPGRRDRAGAATSTASTATCPATASPGTGAGPRSTRNDLEGISGRTWSWLGSWASTRRSTRTWPSGAGTGKPDQRGGAIYAKQAAFHPTKYLNGVPRVAKAAAAAQVPVLHVDARHYVRIETEAGHTVGCEHAVEATDVPLQKLGVVAQMAWFRTYCVALRVPKGAVADVLLYDTADPYVYARLAPYDARRAARLPGGGRRGPRGRAGGPAGPLRGPRAVGAGAVHEYRSERVYVPAHRGRDRGRRQTAGRRLYSPKRVASVIKSAPTMLANDLPANAQYINDCCNRDVADIEDLAPGCGGVLNPMAKTPVAVYKDEEGRVTKLSALCPHLGGVVCWNPVEKSWDCPVHGSWFGARGLAVQGLTKANLAKA